MKILIGEHDRASCLALEVLLHRWGFEVESVHDGWSALRVLDSPNPPRIAILDWMMPGLDGVELCQMLRKESSRPYCYLMLLALRGEKRHFVDGIEAGADDYLAKPVDFWELKSRISTARRMLDMQDQLAAVRDMLREQAMHDPLTGLWNRTVILDTLRREWRRGQRKGTPVGVIMADVDHFKRINDSYGHATGDLVLSEIAQRMCGSLRCYDAIGRYAGEEFLIVLPETDPTETYAVAERLRQAIEGKPIVHVDTTISVTISLGAAASDRIHSEADFLIGEADTALVCAKQEGRNRVELAATLETATPASGG